jgi:hypothetical protein
VAKSLKRVLVYIGCSTVVDHSAHHLKVKGLRPAAVAGTRKDKMAKKFEDSFPVVVAQWLTIHLIILRSRV